MDPNVAYYAMVEALMANDFITAREHADDLRTWLNGGGFPPSPSNAIALINLVA